MNENINIKLYQPVNKDLVLLLFCGQMLKEATPEPNASSSEAEEEREEQPKADSENDPDFSQVRTSAAFLQNV